MTRPCSEVGSLLTGLPSPAESGGERLKRHRNLESLEWHPSRSPRARFSRTEEVKDIVHSSEYPQQIAIFIVAA
jgi:hypothetical protein